jgi:hypothetical protein
MAMRRLKPYFVYVQDSDGNESRYLFEAASHRRAKADARAWVARTSWEPTLISVEPPAERRHRVVAVAVVTLAVAAPTIAAAMMITLTIEGAL